MARSRSGSLRTRKDLALTDREQRKRQRDLGQRVQAEPTQPSPYLPQHTRAAGEGEQDERTDRGSRHGEQRRRGTPPSSATLINAYGMPHTSETEPKRIQPRALMLV